MTHFKKFLASCFCLTAFLAAACSSEGSEDAAIAGQGSVTLGLETATSFTRAVTESDYNDTDLYTVQILNDKGVVTQEFNYAERPASIMLANGSYTLRSFYGSEYKDLPASRNGFYVEGNSHFQVAGKETAVSVTCRPVCGKLSVKWDATMADHFSTYSVVFTTAALQAAGSTAPWSSTDTEPWYVNIPQDGETVNATVTATRKSDNKSATTKLSYKLLPAKSWTLSIKPINNSGEMSISITIDESTNDKPIDIIVPSDWL